MNRLAMMAMAAVALAAGAAFSDGGTWDPGEPVTTYWYGPGCPGTNRLSLAMTDAWARQLKEGGFNTVWARNLDELDIAAKHGLRVIYSVDPNTVWAKVDLDDPVQKAALTERINRVKNHPALYIYEHCRCAVRDGTARSSGGNVVGRRCIVRPRPCLRWRRHSASGEMTLKPPLA